MKLPFNELDFVLFKNAEQLFDSFISNLNNCLAALALMRDDLAKYAEDQLGTKGKWSFTKSTRNGTAYPVKRGGKFDMQEFYFSQEVEISRQKPKAAFFINVEYTCDSDEFKTFVFWWQIGQTKKHIAIKLLFDDSVLSRLKDATIKAGAKCYTYNQDIDSDGFQTIYTAIPVSEVLANESILEQHQLFKNVIVKPLLRYMEKQGKL